MKQKACKTIKFKITIVTVSFTLMITILLASISSYFFQSFVSKNMIQSTEFNLQLIAGVIAQDASSLDTLSKWCCINSEILSYLENPNTNPKEELYTYKRLQEQLQNNRARKYIARLIITDTDHTKFLQVGNATESSPLNPYNIDKLFQNGGGRIRAWQSIEPDPYTRYRPSSLGIIPILRPIYQTSSKTMIGYVYMAVSTALITNQLTNYSVAPDSSLYLTLGTNHYQIGKDKFIKLPANSLEKQVPSPTATLNADTKISVLERKDGSSCQMVSYPVRNSNIVLSHSLSQQELSQQHTIFLRLILLICICILAMGIFITAYLNYLINTPVLRIRRRIKAIAAGNFSSDPNIEWDNELGDIGKGINQLSLNVSTLMESRLADEKKKRDLEYQMLQSQINPHFLYNTLNSIKWMATIQNASGIAEMTTAFSRLLKNIAKGTQKMIPLCEELRLLDDYFLIQQYRYGGSITLIKQIEDTILTNAIPKFTLQPLLENAIFHGIEPKGGAGTIKIEAYRAKNDVCISVTDDGIGMDEKTIKKIFSGNGDIPSGMFKQIGVLNVHKRIQYEYGKNYGITITSAPGVYTKAVIKLPWNPCDSQTLGGKNA